jgi:hypothetical protein
MRAVTLPETPVPKVVREEFAAHRFAGIPRRAIRLRTARGPMTLWVSPHRGGGWCQGLQQPNTRIWVTCAWWKPESGAFGPGFAGPKVFLGRAAATPGRRLQLRFQNGTSLPIPTKDGFYLYRVPDQTLVRAPPHALLLSQGHKEIARDPLFELYGREGLLTRGKRPAGAIVGRSRPVVVQRTSQGPAAIFVAPSKFRPAHCWWLQVGGRGAYGGGCVRDAKSTTSIWSVSPERLSVHGHEVDLLWGRVGQGYPRLGLRFQDGRRLRLPRTGSYFLYVVRGRDRVRGHRPASVVARGASGRVLRKELLLTFTWAH